jgi:3-phosphoshikimate 1-carboxyvinyltransferase
VKVEGSVRVPGDKSLSHRALILGALADGRSSVRGLLDADDVRSTWAALQSLGVDIDWSDGVARIAGVGRRGLRTAASDLDCGNSGTTARLLAGVIAGHPIVARFVGDQSLSRRPMKRIKEPLEAMGAAIDLERGDGLPMVVHGGELRPIAWRTAIASAQTKSAVLLAALSAGVRVELHEPIPTRDHTERLLAGMGANVVVADRAVVLEPVAKLEPLEIHVPGDPSSAAFLIALALLADQGDIEVCDVGLNERRTGFFDVARRMGADISWTVERRVAGEPIGTIRARTSHLRGTTVEGSDVPAMIDELVLLACLATRAEGETTVRGALELRVKESDRIATVVRNLRAIGASAEETDDGFVVLGTREKLRGAIRAEGDHRVAMAFGILARLPGNDIRIDDPSCVAVSYPAFWTDLERISR